jgi:hypothetical protein
MPSEYEALVEALGGTSIPFAEYGWRTRPEGTYGVVGLDFEAGNLNGDTVKQDRVFRASVDLFCKMLADRQAAISEIESAIASVCGASWGLNQVQYEQETGLFHYEWECQVTGTFTEPPEEGT